VTIVLLKFRSLQSLELLSVGLKLSELPTQYREGPIEFVVLFSTTSLFFVVLRVDGFEFVFSDLAFEGG
jgi:hypothetical protein